MSPDLAPDEVLHEREGPRLQAGEVDVVDITDPEGRRVYARALSFVMLRAVRDVLGPEVRVVVENSLVKNYYCEIESPRLPVTPALLAQIEGRMRKLAEAKAPIRKAYFSPEEGYELLKGQGLEDKVELFRYKQTAAVKLYELGRLSSGRAAELAGMARVEFLLSLGRYKVFPLDAELRSLEAAVG